MKLKNLLKEKDINGAQLGRRLGVSRSLVSLWVTGKAVPTTKAVLKIAEELNMPVETIMRCFE